MKCECKKEMIKLVGQDITSDNATVVTSYYCTDCDRYVLVSIEHSAPQADLAPQEGKPAEPPAESTEEKPSMWNDFADTEPIEEITINYMMDSPVKVLDYKKINSVIRALNRLAKEIKLRK